MLVASGLVSWSMAAGLLACLSRQFALRINHELCPLHTIFSFLSKSNAARRDAARRDAERRDAARGAKRLVYHMIPGTVPGFPQARCVRTGLARKRIKLPRVQASRPLQARAWKWGALDRGITVHMAYARPSSLRIRLELAELSLIHI